jgi:hypothetical protein
MTLLRCCDLLGALARCCCWRERRRWGLWPASAGSSGRPSGGACGSSGECGGGCAGGGDVSRPVALGPGHDEGGRWRVPYATIDDASVWPPCRRLADEGDRPPERDQLHDLARDYAEAGTGIGRPRVAALVD